MHIALATSIAAFGLDEDMPLLLPACAQAGVHAHVVAWDDPTVSWSRFDAVVLRSTWDYAHRHSEFLAWCERVDRVSTLLNPLPVVRWNTDKHYLADLQAAGVPVVPGVFVEPEAEPDAEPLPAVQAFLADFADAAEFVVKPAVGAGARDTQRYARAQAFAAANHVGRLLASGRSVLLQPYLSSVDVDGETALLYFDGEFSHAIRKGPLLVPDEGPSNHLFAAEAITARTPGEDELAVGSTVLAALQAHLDLETTLPYARVDLIRSTEGRPQLLELELAEPSLFFAHGPGAAERFAERLCARLRLAATAKSRRSGASR
jgi:O-ureido-D-serine cyclo-ligase